MTANRTEPQGLEIRCEKVTHGGREVDLLILVGYLDGHTAPNLMRELDRMLGQGENLILLDVTDLEYMSSAGFGVLAAVQKRAQETGGDLKVVGLSPKIKRIFASLGLTNMISCYDSRTEALDSF